MKQYEPCEHRHAPEYYDTPCEHCEADARSNWRFFKTLLVVACVIALIAGGVMITVEAGL